MIDNPKTAAAVLKHCEEQGVQDYCLAAGARNAPLALALLAGVGNPRKVYHFFDERAAAFFALGRAIATRHPVAVVTTSGTAVAELLPAVVEAYYQAVPLVAITADRPEDFRGSGAPQAIEQPGIFGPYAECVDVSSVETNLPRFGPGPVHINVPFGDPTSEVVPVEPQEVDDELDDDDYWLEWKGYNGLDQEALNQIQAFIEGGKVAVAVGSLHRSEIKAVTSFLIRLGASVYAEPASNLHLYPGLEPQLKGGLGRNWQKVLNDVDRVLRIGGVPVARWWRDMETNNHTVLNLSPSGHRGLSRPCEVIKVDDFSGLERLTVGEKMEVTLGDLLGDEKRMIGPTYSEFPQSDLAMIHAVSKLVRNSDDVFLGNSLPVRDWDLAAVRGEHFIYANRGANGIDGALSTALGIGVGGYGSWAVVGDLTALYDLSAPWIISQLDDDHRIRIVVINNGGGKIFGQLPALAGLDSSQNGVIQNRHELEFANWAAMWGLGYLEVMHIEDLPGHDDELPDQVVIELVTDPEQSEAARKQSRGE